MSTDIQSKVLCVSLKKSCLGTSFVDGYLTETLEVQTGAQNRKVKGSKKILGDGIKPIQSVLRKLGEFVKEQTLPGISPDLRIVTPKSLAEIQTEVDAARASIAEELLKLGDSVEWTDPRNGETATMSKWQALIRQDEIDLDKAFSLSDYPPFENLNQFFDAQLTVCDLPQGDYFRIEGLTEDAVQKLKESHAKTLDAVKAAGKNEVQKKLVELLSRVAENLDKEDISLLRNSTLTNLQEYLAKVPDLNITNDPVLEAMRVEATEKLAFTMGQLKASAVLKEQAKEAAKSILSRIGTGTRRLAMPIEPADDAIQSPGIAVSVSD